MPFNLSLRILEKYKHVILHRHLVPNKRKVLLCGSYSYEEYFTLSFPWFLINYIIYFNN